MKREHLVGVSPTGSELFYNLDLLLDLLPPASVLVLVYSLKRMCHSFEYVAVKGEIW